MKYLIKLLSLLCLLSGTSCVSTQPRIMKSAPVAASMSIELPNIKFERIASIEHRYSTEGMCRDSAKWYYNNRLGKPGTPTALPTSPLTYSFQDSTNKQNRHELRFMFQVGSPTEPTNTIITYRTFQKRIRDDKNDLDDAVKNLKNVYKCITIKGTTQDLAEVNKKRPWRAIMKTTEDIDSTKSPALTSKISGTFGVIVNPPFP